MAGSCDVIALGYESTFGDIRPQLDKVFKLLHCVFSYRDEAEKNKKTTTEVSAASLNPYDSYAILGEKEVRTMRRKTFFWNTNCLLDQNELSR